MSLEITSLDFAELEEFCSDNIFNKNSIFVLPNWLQTWWRCFGSVSEQYLCKVTEGKRIIGIAPLLIQKDQARFIGSADICDYLDFIVAPGKETAFFSTLLDDIKRRNISQLFLESLRYDSISLSILAELARQQGYAVTIKLTDVSLDLELPISWEKYLQLLKSKPRRELQRKLRRLYEAGDIKYSSTFSINNLQHILEVFFKQHRESREDKALFMTPKMETFFRVIARTMSNKDMLSFGVLELDNHPVAIVMCFYYKDIVYLYNSGYDRQYSALSVGFLSKIFSIKDSIERGFKRYDLLKGAEEYKYRLAGKEIPIYNCLISFT